MGSNKPTKRPNIPPAESQDFNEAVREVVQTLQGERGDPLDRAVTWRDLDREGFTDAVRRAGTAPGDGDRPPLEDGTDPGDRIVPPKPNGFGALGVFTSIVLSWSLPLYGNHARTLVFRSNTPSFGGASEIGSSPGQTYTDTVGTGVTRYYWIRFVSTEGVEGPVVGPASGTTPVNPEQALEEVTNQVRNSGLFSLLRDEVKGVDTEKTVGLLGDNWSIKVEDTINGETIVGGIGLAINGPESNNPGTVDFGVVADNFWVANPNIDYSQEDRDIPFFIDTETGEVHIDVALIKDATITDAKIFDLRAEKLTVGNGGAIITKALLGQLAVTDAFISNRIESGGVIRDSNNEIVFENEGTEERPVLVPQFQSTFVPGSSGFRIDPRTGDAEFNNQKIRGILHNGALDSNGDVDFNQDPRFIDFRSGSPTEGDFQLGDVDGDNFISFKFEPAVGDRILRVRGDILLRNYEIGDILLLDAGSSDLLDLTDPRFQPNINSLDTVLYWWPTNDLFYEVNPDSGNNFQYFPARDLQQDQIEDQLSNTFLAKEVVVTREGRLSLKINIKQFGVIDGNSGASVFSEYYIVLITPSGRVEFTDTLSQDLSIDPAFAPSSPEQLYSRFITVRPQYRIQIRWRGRYRMGNNLIRVIYGIPRYPSGVIELDNLAIDGYNQPFSPGNDYFQPETQILSFRLEVGFFPQETVIK